MTLGAAGDMFERLPLEVRVRERDAGRLVVGVAGEIDQGSAAAFLDGVLRLRLDGDRHLILDMSGCEFCDSAGIRALVQLTGRVEDGGGRMCLAASQSSVRRLLEMTGLGELLPNHPTVADALAALRSR